jgi:hypothetical protein
MEHIQLGITISAIFIATGMTQKLHDKFNVWIIVKYPSGVMER